MMGKRPHLEMVQLTLAVPRGFDGLWSIIRDLDRIGPWSARDVDLKSNVDPGTVRDLIRRLVRSGYAQVVRHDRRGTQRVPTASYRLLERPVDCPRIRRDGRRLGEAQNDRLWRAIRMAKTFTADELAEYASTEVKPTDREVARRYARELAAAGILARVDAGGGRGKVARYRLHRNVGTKAPMILRAHIVFDPNSNTVVGTADAKEVA